MDKTCDAQNSISDKDVHREQVKDKKQLWDEFESKNITIKLIIENFKQLADSIWKSKTSVPFHQTPDFLENNNFILPKK